MGSSLSTSPNKQNGHQRRNSNSSNFSKSFSSKRKKHWEELHEIDTNLDQINTDIVDFERIKDRQLYSDIHSRIIKIVDRLQTLKKTYKDTNEIEKVRYLESRSKDSLHRLLQQNYYYERDQLDVAAVESTSFVAAPISTTTNKIKGLKNSLEKKLPATVQERLEQVERNIPLMEKQLEKALHLHQHNQLVVIEKKVVLHEKDLENIEIKHNRRLQRKREYLTVGLQKLKIKTNKVKTDVKKIDHLFRKLSSLEHEVSKFSKTKVDESYKVIEKNLQNVENEIEGITTDFQYVHLKKVEIYEKVQKLMAILNKMAEENEQNEIKGQIVELRLLEDQLRNIQVQLVDLSESDHHNVDHYEKLQNDLKILYESLSKINGMGAHMQHKQVMMQVIQNTLQQLNEKVQNNGVSQKNDDNMCELLNNFEQQWEEILKKLKFGVFEINDLNYIKTLLGNVSGGIHEILGEIDPKRATSGAFPKTTDDSTQKHLNDINKRVSYVQIAVEKDMAVLNPEEQKDLKKALTNYQKCLDEMTLAKPEEVEALKNKINVTVQKLESPQTKSGGIPESDELKSIVEHLQRLKGKVENFSGSYRNTLYVTIEKDLNKCLKKSEEFQCFSDEKLENAKRQIVRKINHYLRVLEERSTKDFEIVDDEHKQNEKFKILSKEITELYRKIEKFEGTTKNDQNYTHLVDSLKTIEDELDRMSHSEKRDDLKKALKKSLVSLDSKLQQNYLNLINLNEKCSPTKSGAHQNGDGNPGGELDQIETDLVGLKKQVDEYSNFGEDTHKYTLLDEGLMEMFVRLDKVDVNGDRGLQDRKNNTTRDVQNCAKILEEKVKRMKKL